MGANLFLTQVPLSKDLSSVPADGWAPLQRDEWGKLAEHIRKSGLFYGTGTGKIGRSELVQQFFIFPLLLC